LVLGRKRGEKESAGRFCKRRGDPNGEGHQGGEKVCETATGRIDLRGNFRRVDGMELKGGLSGI